MASAKSKSAAAILLKNPKISGPFASLLWPLCFFRVYRPPIHQLLNDRSKINIEGLQRTSAPPLTLHKWFSTAAAVPFPSRNAGRLPREMVPPPRHLRRHRYIASLSFSRVLLPIPQHTFPLTWPSHLLSSPLPIRRLPSSLIALPLCLPVDAPRPL